MKKILLSATALLAASMMYAQSSQIDQFFQKYEGKEGFTSVIVTEKLFSLVASATEESAEWDALVDGIKGIRILVYENEEGAATKSGQFYNEFMSTVNTSGFDELMNVTSETEKVKLYGKSVTGSTLNDMLLVCDADGEFVMISILGAIDLSKISQISDLDIEGLDELKKIEETNTDQK